MKYRVYYAERASADAVAAYEWIKQYSEAAANRWLSGLRNATNSLDQFPQRCGLAPESEHFKQEIRHLLYARYRILFRVVENRVEIIHIRHGARAVLGSEMSDADE